MAAGHSKEDNDSLNRGFYGIPDDNNLRIMSFVELCSELSSCEKGSPKFLTIEREIKKHIARDQAKAARPNILLGAIIAGVFTILGALIGGFLKTCSACQSVHSTTTAPQPRKEDVTVKPPVIADMPSQQVEMQPKESGTAKSNKRASNVKP